MRRIFVAAICLALLSGLAACAAKPVLLSKSGANPAGVDLSGRWELRQESGAPLARGGEQEQTIRMPRRTSSRRPQRESRPPREQGPEVQIFLETGKVLKISQTVDGLFISFDRAIVEEYRFGENRIVAIGPIEAQRVSGWEEGAFVIETADEQGMVLTESWALDEGGSALVREISIADGPIADGEKAQFSTQQVFDRS